MLLSRVNLSATLAILLLLLGSSVTTLNQNVSKLHKDMTYSATAIRSPTTYPRKYHQGQAGITGAMLRRSNTPCPIIGCKYFQRYPKYVIVPTIMAAETLKSFWYQISIDAMQADVDHITNAKHFTITAGALQLTISCVGQAIPWDFVQDFASNQIQAVAIGWLNTFDAIYQQDSTGYLVFVSLKIVESVKGSPSRKRPHPGADWKRIT